MTTLLATNGHAATRYIVTREKRRNNRLCGSGAWGNLCPPRSHGRDGDDEMGKHKERTTPLALLTGGILQMPPGPAVGPEDAHSLIGRPALLRSGSRSKLLARICTGCARDAAQD